MHLLETHLYPPRSDRRRFSRSVTEKARTMLESRHLTLVRAPAGYGKTMLLVDCFEWLKERSVPALWLSLNGFDGSIVQFVSYLAHGLVKQGVAGPEFLDQVTDAKECPDHDMFSTCAAFDALFYRQEQRTYFFLDDFDSINGTPAQALFTALLRHTSEKAHWIVSCRSYPRMPLARMRVLGELGEIEIQDLRFSAEETTQFLKSIGASATLASFAHTRTEGWPAGLQLVSIALERGDGDESRFISRWQSKLRGIATFFREEIFPNLDPELQRFLLRTSVLTRLTPPLCDALTERQNSRQMILKLMEENLFIFSLDEDGQWYRYHDLFAEFLLDIIRESQPSLEPELHLKASQWLVANDLTGEALAHAIKSRDEKYAVQQISELWHNLIGQGEFVHCGHVISSLSTEALNASPNVLLWYVVYLFVLGRFAEADIVLSSLERRIANGEFPEESENRRFAYALRNRRLLLAFFCREIDKAEDLVPELLEHRAELDAFSDATLQLSIALIKHERYCIRECGEYVLSSRELFANAGFRSMLVWHSCIAAPILLQAGETHLAKEYLHEAIDMAQECSSPGRQPELLSMPLALLAELKLENSEREEARQMFERAESCANGIGFVEYWIARYVGRARLAFFEGDASIADDLLNKGHTLAKTRRLEKLHWAVAHERIRQSVALGELARAAQLALDAGLPASETDLRPGPDVIALRELKALAWVRMAVASGRHADAIQLLNAWMQFAEPRGAQATMVRFCLLMARALHATGDVRGALRAMRKAIDFASPTCMAFSFLQEGELIRSLASKCLGPDQRSYGARPFLTRLANALSLPELDSGTASRRTFTEPISTNDAPVEHLTPREIDILRKVACGLLYKEVADQLGLTEGSVKWYMQQIYGKLAVRRRLHAVEKGRSLGYI